MQPGAVLTSLLSVAAAAGVWCWSRYELGRMEWQLRAKAGKPAAAATPADSNASPTTLEAAAVIQKRVVDMENRLRDLEKENAGLRQKLAEALEAAKPPPTPDEVATRLVTLRELAFRSTPKWVAATPEDILQRAAAHAADGITPEAGAARVRGYLAMGFVAEPFDYRLAISSLAGTKSGGFYDKATGQFFYQQDASLARSDSRDAFAGALLPALLAQNFPTAALPSGAPDNDDAARAAQALIFGDANFTRVRFSIGDQLNSNFDRGQAPAVPPPSPNAPQFLYEVWKWADDSGNLFVQSLHSRGGLPAVNAAYQRMPQSTAEIMHPEKLHLANPPFAPVNVALADTTVAGIAPLFTNVAGELGAYFLIRAFADVDLSTAATEGWAGDRYCIWPGSAEHGDHLLWRTAWTRPEDAKEFFDAMRRVVMQRRHIPWQKEYDIAPDQFHVDDPHRIIRLRRHGGGKLVTLIDATDPAFAKTMDEKFPAD